MTGIIVKNYEHINRALPNWDTNRGKYIRSKAHYEKELDKAGMVRNDSIHEFKPKLKEYKLSNNAREIIESAKNSKDSKGNVKLSGRTIDAMVKIGAINKKIPNYMKLPENYKKGGFI